MPKEMGAEFVTTDRVPYNSVVTTGTHDTSTLRMWWSEDRDRVRSLYNNVLRLAEEAPERCTSEIAKKILADVFTGDLTARVTSFRTSAPRSGFGAVPFSNHWRPPFQGFWQ